MAITSKLSRHKIMERAIKALMANNLPPRFKFKDTYASIEVPTAYTQHLPTQQEIEDKFTEIEAEEEAIVVRESSATIISKDDSLITSNLEVGTANLFVDTLTGNVGIGTTNPVGILHIHSTDSIILPSGTTEQRSQTPVSGMLRYNTTDSKLEVYVSSDWKYIGYQPTYLYEFTSHTFTNAGATGQSGPTLTQCRNAYNVTWDENTSFFNVVTQGIQEWTVPDTGTYEIDAYGATGGYAYLWATSTISYGGRGARLRGRFSLTKGDMVKILVGQMGVNKPNDSRGGGGGGGTFVYNNTTSTLLIAAGGGGGGGQYSRPSTTDANYSLTNGNAGSNSGGNGPGGTNGNGAGAGNYAGGGAGWITNGINSVYYGQGGGFSFNSGGTGGAPYSDGVYGGFGGGGGGYIGGGGGGGYSGGGAGGWSYSGHGGGGGSYMDTSATNTLRDLNTVENTHGKVIVTLI